MWAVSIGRSSAVAATVVVHMPLYGRVASMNLLAEAEQRVAAEIEQRLAQGDGSEPIEILILGDRNGDLVPVLLTTVSPSQWQQNPQVRRWSQYYDSYALLDRHDQDAVAATPSSNRTSQSSSPPPPSYGVPLSAIEEAYDAGTLSGELAQEYLDELD
ncbi:MAG: hypothetical protein AB4042_14130 [Leptolyngbyaceae cyanobacterium]